MEQTNQEKLDSAKFAINNAVYDVMKSANVGAFDVTTNVRQKKVPIPPNVMVFQLSARMCAIRMTGSSCRIVLFLIGKGAYENLLGIDQQTIAEELNLSLRAVNGGIKELIEANIVQTIQSSNDKRRIEYFINPAFSWKGHSYSRKKRIEKMEDESQTSLDLFGEKQPELNGDFYKPKGKNKKLKILPPNESFLQEKLD